MKESKLQDCPRDRGRNPGEPFLSDKAFVLPGKLQSEFETMDNTTAITWIWYLKEEYQNYQEPLSYVLNSKSAGYFCKQFPPILSRKQNRLCSIPNSFESQIKKTDLHKQNPRDHVISIFLFLLLPSLPYKLVGSNFPGYLPWTSRNAAEMNVTSTPTVPRQEKTVCTLLSFSVRASIWRLCTCSRYPWQMQYAFILIEWCFHNRMGVWRSWHTLWMLSWVRRSGEGWLLHKVHVKSTRPGLPSSILRTFEEVFFLKRLGSSLENPIRYFDKE